MNLRAAGRGRLAYESVLALALAGSTAAVTVAFDQLPAAATAGLALLDIALVVLRHRFPAGVLIVASALSGLTGRADTLLLLGLSYSAGFRIRGPSRLALTLAAALAGIVGGGLLHHGRAYDLSALLFGGGLFVVVSIFPAVAAQLSAQRRQILTLMHERTVTLRRQQEIVAERARVREATRIAREMHDSLGHRLTLISLYTGALKSSPATPGTLELLHSASTSAMDELRHIVKVLGDGPAPSSGLASLDDLVADARSAGATVELTRTGTAVEVPPMVDQAAYRTLQEGVTNALRHAVGAPIRMALRYEDDALIAEVGNGAGRPGSGPTGGQGLYGLEERVRLAGGVLYHGPEPGGGFRVAATLPLTSVAPQAARPAPAEGSGDEFSDHLRRLDVRRRMWTVGLAAGVLLVAAMCGGGLWIAIQRQTVSAATYEGVHVGDAASDVLSKLPSSEEAKLDSPRPDCVIYQAAPSLRGKVPNRYRFCFEGGRLSSKEAIENAG